MLPWKPEFRYYLAQNLMQPIPYPNNALDEIWLWLTSWSQRYPCLKVWTDPRTPARVPSYKLTESLRLRWAKNITVQIMEPSSETVQTKMSYHTRHNLIGVSDTVDPVC